MNSKRLGGVVCDILHSSPILALALSCSVGAIGCSGSTSSTGGLGGSNAVGGGNASGGAHTGGSSASPSGGAAATGGTSASGGSNTGGTAQQPTGGRSATGGSAAGGSATGGTATGGTATGGSATATGGSNPATGGAATGGAGVGGSATGGSTPTATGGRTSGGAASGGAPTGGQSATGGSSMTATGGASSSTGGSTGTYVGNKTPGTAQTGDITVDPTKTHQVVDGFGEADVWQGSSSTTMQTLLWDPVNGIGLNLLRIGIESVSGKSVLMGNAGVADGQACKKFSGNDCKIWAAPWSPPASMKGNSNVNGNNAGACSATATSRLNTGSYDAWATMLAGFPATYKAQSGLDLYAISAQNEPDWNPNYEACCYTGPEMVNFINVLGPKLAALTPQVKLLAAEPDNWGNFWGGDNYATDILANASASSYVTILATHDYGGTSAGTYARPAPPASNTHHIWETECTPGDTGPITIATMIYAAFNTGGANGWHYWWTQSFIPNASSPPPQYYALGNFSKFVRPGYYRVDVTGAAAASASNPAVIAFTSLTDGTVSIVIVNPGAARTLSFFVAGTAWPASVTPYVTTSTSKLAAGAAIPVTAARFSASLQAASVTTFVGKP